LVPTPTSTLTPVPTLSPTFTISPTSDPYDGLSVDDLSLRSYGGGVLEIREVLAENRYFTRYLISYPSDSLSIYGFMNVPKEDAPGKNPTAPYPVIIALHGYIDPTIYNTIDYTTRYADALARAGFLVIHPNLRGYPPSDIGEDRFRVGMAIDVLNLIAIIEEQAGESDALALAQQDHIGLWGHSMGGGISTRVITVSNAVKAAVLYGAMSADEQKNFERIYHYFSGGTRGWDELQAPEEVFRRISPIFFLDRIQAAVSIHHGKVDVDVPLSWSLDLCDRLKKLKKSVECYVYSDQAHTFSGSGDQVFIRRTIDFYNQQLRSP
jgi:dipeptidyl aminopeptidase/acylaminoacyl peptidase